MRKNTLKVKISGIETEVCTLSYIADKAGKTSQTLRVMERKGKFPTSKLRLPPNKDKAGAAIASSGARVYPMSVAIKLADVLSKEVKQGIAVAQSTVDKLFRIMAEN